jgi:uncharacterized protein YecT (DUF1311 family)
VDTNSRRRPAAPRSLLVLALLTACLIPLSALPAQASGPRSKKVEPPVISETFTLVPCSRQSTMGMVGCTEHETVASDKLIDAEFALLFTITGVQQEKALISAERAWLAYRKADCESAASIFEGGTFANVEFGSCVVSADNAYSENLHAYFRLLTQGSVSVPHWP